MSDEEGCDFGPFIRGLYNTSGPAEPGMDKRERTVNDLPEGKARSHAISRMEDAYVKIQKTYNIMGSGFGKMTQEDLNRACTLLYESYNLMVHARRDFTYGFKEE